MEFVCFGTEGNGQLAWLAENEEASALLDTFRGQSGALSGSVLGSTVSVIYSSNNMAALFVANVSAYSDTFECYSEESGLSRTVTATTGEFDVQYIHVKTLLMVLLLEAL